MRYVLVFGIMLCLLLSGCEYFIPDTSNALSQVKQEEQLQKQTEQIKQQTEALERLANAVEKLASPQAR